MYKKLNRKKILRWEMLGIIFISILGALLHFVFELSGGMKAVAIIGAVNESVWEHLKIGFWPAFIWAVIEFFIFGKYVRNFLIAKGASITIISISITTIYYGSVVLGIESLAVDIGNFFISIVIAQVISYRIMLIQKFYRSLNIVGAILIIINILGFSLLTYFPPECPLFKDPATGGYGITGHVH
jgi:hypothetical protein